MSIPKEALNRTKQSINDMQQNGTNSPVWLLGNQYQFPSSSPANVNASSPSSSPSAARSSRQQSKLVDQVIYAIIDDFESLIWFSYRKDFAPIAQTLPRKIKKRLLQNQQQQPQEQPAESYWQKFKNQVSNALSSGYTSDAGWGCMLRTGQMMIAHAFVLNYLGRNWRLPKALRSTYQIQEEIQEKLQNQQQLQELHELQEQMLQQTYSYSELQRHHPIQQQPSGAQNQLHHKKRNAPHYYSKQNHNHHHHNSNHQHHGAHKNKQKINTQAPQAAANNEQQVQAVDANDGALVVMSDAAAALPANYHMILGFFQDKPECPFSIHNIAQCGTLYSKKIGEWFSPSTISFVMQRLVKEYFKDMCVYVADQGCIYMDEIVSTCSAPPTAQSLADSTIQVQPNIPAFKPVIILIPLRLGLDKLNEAYKTHLCKSFEIPFTLGIVGGRPNNSLYFVGYQGDSLMYLDPHTVQKTCSDFQTYHYASPQWVKIVDIDPSLTLGFFCKDKSELDQFLVLAKQYFVNVPYPILSVQESKPNMAFLDDDESGFELNNDDFTGEPGEDDDGDDTDAHLKRQKSHNFEDNIDGFEEFSRIDKNQIEQELMYQTSGMPATNSANEKTSQMKRSGASADELDDDDLVMV